MNKEIIHYFQIQRHIFGVCPCCDEIFRVSESDIYRDEKPAADWLDRHERAEARVTAQEDKHAEVESELRESAREKGRRQAMRAVRKVDPVFAPNRLNPDDAKVIFHPIDFIVFNGMKKANQMRNIILLDRQAENKGHRAIQKSIERTIRRGAYDWITVRVQEDGSIEYE